MPDLIPDLNNISLDRWDHLAFRQRKLRADVLRLDKIHAEISGNKWFKLKYYFEKAKVLNKKTLISFGGTYSNHILALAAAAKMYGFNSVGFIRGEEPVVLSHTLVAAKKFGMTLKFFSRQEYNSLKNQAEYNNTDILGEDALIIPEGGAGPEGILGAEDIMSLIPFEDYSHICCAMGTGATLAGLANCAGPYHQLIGVSVIKGTRGFEPMNLSWTRDKSVLEKLRIIHEDHFGGYAKYSRQLVDFMNSVFSESQIPTDFVYTGKLFYSIVRLSSVNQFPAGSRILVLHTGGLQGNRSLPPGLLQF